MGIERDAIIDGYHAEGWRVIPCQGKQRLTKADETFNLKDYGEDCNIAVLTGESSGLVVIDKDGLHHDEFIERMDLENTRVQKTPSGGLHYFFKLPEKVTIRNAQDVFGTKQEGYAIDVRGEGGYVVVCPSPGYEWVTSNPVRELPVWMLTIITSKVKEREEREKGERFKGAAKGEGKRVVNALEAIGSLIARGYRGDELWNLVTAVNDKNEPPLPEDFLGQKISEFIAKEEQKVYEGVRLFIPNVHLDSYREHLNTQLKNKKKDPEFTTGFAELDQKVWGFVRKKFAVIVGVPNSGKSLVLNISAYENAKRGKCVLFFSTETDYYDVLNRIFIYEYGIDSLHFNSGDFTTAEIRTIRDEAFPRFKSLPIFICDEFVSIDELERITRQVKPDIVYVDHFQEMDMADGSPATTAKIVKRLKQLALAENVALVVSSQPNEKTQLKKTQDGSYETRKSEITASSVRTTQTLWQAPHLMILLNTREEETEEPLPNTVVKVGVCKNKVNGAKPTMYYRLDRGHLRFEHTNREEYTRL